MKKIFLIAAVSTAALIFIVFLNYDRINGETRECNDYEAVTSAKFAKLSGGVTHYDLRGPEKAEWLVLIHGVSGPMAVWDATIDDLALDYRVLRYDLYGRGLSERVPEDHNQNLYDRQLSDLLEKLRAPDKVTLVGSSMGAVIAGEFRNRHPKQVRRLVFVGPAGFPIKASPLSAATQIPFAGDVMMGLFGTQTLTSHNRKYFFKPERNLDVQRAFSEQLKCRGSKAAILSTMRHMPIQDFQKGFEEVGKSKVPVLLVWGMEDKTFPFEHHKDLQTWVPHAMFAPIPEAGHLPQYEQSAKVNAVLRTFLHMTK